MDDDTPKPDPAYARWTPQRKAALVTEVRSGRRAVEDVYREHGVTALELVSWAEAFDRYGLDGLKVTKARGSDRNLENRMASSRAVSAPSTVQSE